ncbi:hypothetical protein CCP3SC15_2840003 [Gammaproteobacteria bacterium]
MDFFHGLEGAAALTSALDLVIAVGNAAGEIAAALGVPVWCLESHGRPWTSLEIIELVTSSACVSHLYPSVISDLRRLYQAPYSSLFPRCSILLTH